MSLSLLETPGRPEKLAVFYRSTLLYDVIPLWLRHGKERLT